MRKFNRKPPLKSTIAAVVEPRITKAENTAPINVDTGNKIYLLNPRVSWLSKLFILQIFKWLRLNLISYAPHLRNII